jgi:hypothetical protein
MLMIEPNGGLGTDLLLAKGLVAAFITFPSP